MWLATDTLALQSSEGLLLLPSPRSLATQIEEDKEERREDEDDQRLQLATGCRLLRLRVGRLGLRAEDDRQGAQRRLGQAVQKSLAVALQVQHGGPGVLGETGDLVSARVQESDLARIFPQRAADDREVLDLGDDVERHRERQQDLPNPIRRILPEGGLEGSMDLQTTEGGG